MRQFHFFDLIREFARSDRGAVAMMAGLIVPIVIGMLSLSAEFSRGLAAKVENQRVADIAAVAAANAYSSSSSTTTMTSVAQNVATLNGLASTSAVASVVTSPRTSGSSAVRVVVTTSTPLYFASVVGFGRSMSVSATAYAELGSSSSCILALSGSASGVTLSGGTSITAPDCGVASNSSATVPCGTTISAKSLSYNGNAPTIGCSGVTGSIKKASTSDPIAGNAGVTSASARATAAGSLTAPTIPSVTTGPNLNFAWNASENNSALSSQGCTGTFNSGTWTVTCPAGGTYRFGSLNTGGGITVNFNVLASATYTFSGVVSNSGGGSTLSFGAGSFTMAAGLRNTSRTSFGGGTFNIGRDSTACNGANTSICNPSGATLTFGGPSTFVITSGIYNGGGATLTMGSGTTNVFRIGPASDGNALNIGGGATTNLADATTFTVVGNITEGGGSCLYLSAATVHDIKGNVNVMGGATLGAGLWAISGYFGAGVAYGGDVTCNGVTVGVSGVGVTIAVAGQSTISGGTCNGAAICFGSGFSNVNLTAPSSGTYDDLVLLGPQTSSNTAGIYVNEGASTTLGGVVYAPYGSMTLTGGASVGNAANQCLQIVARDVTLTGGTRITAKACITSSGGGSVKLVN